jgi:UDP-N-acetylmuramate dehydrogenase
MQLSIKENAPIAPYCSMKAGGNAKYLCFPENPDELKACILLMREKDVKTLILGNASNTLFSDEGYDGAIIFTTRINNVEVSGLKITAECGAPLSSLSTIAVKEALTGLEFSYGIPGTVGGGVFMNAGAYGGELCDCFAQALFLTPSLKEIVLTRDEMGFSYRKSVMSDKGFILLSATFELKKGDPVSIRAAMDNFMRLRKEKQPLEYPSCGSAFKRPPNAYAGALIEQCGLKGYSIGGAQVSEKHAGFIINKDNAKANDIIKLIDYVSDTVYEKTGIRLEPEIRIYRNS